MDLYVHKPAQVLQRQGNPLFRDRGGRGRLQTGIAHRWQNRGEIAKQRNSGYGRSRRIMAVSADQQVHGGQTALHRRRRRWNLHAGRTDRAARRHAMPGHGAAP